MLSFSMKNKILHRFESFTPRNIDSRKEEAKKKKIFITKEEIRIEIVLKGEKQQGWIRASYLGKENNYFDILDEKADFLMRLEVHLEDEFSEPWDGEFNYIPEVQVTINSQDHVFKIVESELKKVSIFCSELIIENYTNGALDKFADAFEQGTLIPSKKYREFMYDNVTNFSEKILTELKTLNFYESIND